MDAEIILLGEKMRVPEPVHMTSLANVVGITRTPFTLLEVRDAFKQASVKGAISNQSLISNATNIRLSHFFAGTQLEYKIVLNPHGNATVTDGILRINGASRATEYDVKVTATNGWDIIVDRVVRVAEYASLPFFLPRRALEYPNSAMEDGMFSATASNNASTAYRAFNKSTTSVWETTDRNVPRVIWRTHANNSQMWWRSLCWSPQKRMFVAVASPQVNTVGEYVMTSSDGEVWTERVAQRKNWADVCWSPDLGVFAAISHEPLEAVMTSADGMTWVTRVVPAGGRSICWSPQLTKFVTVGKNAMTSSDGITWALQTIDDGGGEWSSVCWSPERQKFVAVRPGNSACVMTSSDGVAWTKYSPSLGNQYEWSSVCWSPELLKFLAVANHSMVMMTSSDGMTWTPHDVPHLNWMKVCWVPDLRAYVAVHGTTTSLMVSLYGFEWTTMKPPDNLSVGMRTVCWSPELRKFAGITNTYLNSHYYDRVTTGIPDGSYVGKEWVQLTVPNPMKVSKITLQAPASTATGMPIDFDVQASSDGGVTWLTQPIIKQRDASWSINELKEFNNVVDTSVYNTIRVVVNRNWSRLTSLGDVTLYTDVDPPTTIAAIPPLSIGDTVWLSEYFTGPDLQYSVNQSNVEITNGLLRLVSHSGSPAVVTAKNTSGAIVTQQVHEKIS